MIRKKPGQSVRATITAAQLGVLGNPPSLVVSVHFPDGTTITPDVTNDAEGNYHADFAIPFPMPPGYGVVRVVATGTTTAQGACIEELFEVQRLYF